MTAPTTITCPSWCNTGPTCDGEHYSEVKYLAATAGLPRSIDPHGGARYPLIGVATVFSVTEDQAPFVSLGITDANFDLELRVPEVRELIMRLQEALVAIG